MARSPRAQLIIDGRDNTRDAFTSVQKGLGALEKKTASAARTLAGLFAGVISTATFRRIADTNAEFVRLNNTIRANTSSTEEFNQAQDGTREIADALGHSLGTVVDNYATLAGAMDVLGYSTKQTLQLTESLSKAYALDGMGVDAAASATTRFARALQRGELHHARFLLMMEQQPGVMNLISEATGKTIQELRALSEEGQLSADILVNSMLSVTGPVSEAYEEMPKTIEQAMQRVRGNVAEAFSDEDLMQPVAESLNELADILKDPAVREGLASLAAGMAGAAKAGAGAASEYGALGQQLGYYAAAVTGNVSELDKLEAQIKDVDRALKGSWMSRPIQYLSTSEEDLKRIRSELEKQKEAIIDAQTGTTAEMREAQQERQSMLQAEQAKEAAIHNQYVTMLESHSRKAVEAAESRGKELVKAEKDAARKVADARKDGAELLKKIDESIARTAAGGDAEPSFGEYQKLSAGAQQSLASGDTEKAKEQALAAVEMLETLAKSGANTYGFEGLQQQMRAVAEAASDIERTEAEEALENIQLEMASLAEQAEQLKEMPVSLELDEESLETARTQIQKLLDDLKIEAVIPVKLAGLGGTGSDNIPGFAGGGRIRGPGTGTSDSILARVSDGEYVVRAAAVRKYGADTLDRLNNMQIPKFNTGGMVNQLANAAPAQPKPLGTLNFNLPGGESFSVDALDWSDDLRRAAMKYGRPGRR